MSPAVEELLARRGSARRADAQRNVERLLAAARAAMDEEGLGVTTREVASRAGVGLGTLYRQVGPLKDLMAAILLDLIAEMTAAADEAREGPDPWAGFTGFAETFVQLRATSCGLHDVLGDEHEEAVSGEVTHLREAVGELVRHVQAAGALRSDIDWRDVPFALAGAIPTDHTMGMAADDDQWRRNLRIIFDGLRA